MYVFKSLAVTTHIKYKYDLKNPGIFAKSNISMAEKWINGLTQTPGMCNNVDNPSEGNPSQILQNLICPLLFK